MNIQLKKNTLACLSVGMLTIYGCGGGSSGTTNSAISSANTLTLQGTAATGAAVAGGAVSVKCATGVGSATTNADGTYTVTVAGGTAPCLIKVVAVDASGVSNEMYSAVDVGQTTANVTPLTQMVVANALGSDPATVFSAGISGTTASNLSTASLNAAVTNVKSVLTDLGLDASTLDPLKAPLVAATDTSTGNTQDQLIDGLMATLKTSNISLSTVTTVMVTNPTSPTTAVTALKNAADPLAPLSTSSLNSCPVARTGGYWYAAPGDTSLAKIVINFDATTSFIDGSGRNIPAMSGYDYSNSDSFTVAQIKDANDTSSSQYTPCAYRFTLNAAINPDQTPVNVRVSSAGLGAFSISGAGVNATFPDATTRIIDNGITSAAGIVIPAQKKWTNADLAGTMYALHFSKVKAGVADFGSLSPNITRNFFSRFEIAADGLSAKAWVCPTLDTCPANTSQPVNTFTISAPVNGVFTMTSVIDPVDTKFVVFRGASGDTFVMGVNTTASSSLANNFVVMSNRVSAMTLPSVGSTTASWNWTIKNVFDTTNNVNALAQDSFFDTKTIQSVNAGNNSFVRSWTEASPFTDIFTGTSTSTVTDTITMGSPLPGMSKRTNNNAGKKDVVSLTGQGWSISVSANPGQVAGDTVGLLRGKNFLSISIKKP